MEPDFTPISEFILMHWNFINFVNNITLSINGFTNL